MISLDGAVTLSQMDHISEAVCKDLKLNMSRIYHEMFNIHGTVAKSDLRLFSGGCIGFRKFLRCVCHTHAFSATAKSCLDDHRITDSLSFLKTGFNILHIPFAARNYRNTSCDHGASCNFFIAQHTDDL